MTTRGCSVILIEEEAASSARRATGAGGAVRTTVSAITSRNLASLRVPSAALARHPPSVKVGRRGGGEITVTARTQRRSTRNTALSLLAHVKRLRYVY